MSNEAYLIATDVPGPCIGNIGQDKKSVLLANAPLAVPVYWISLFDSSHLVRLEVPGEEGPVEIPSLAAEMGDAKRLLGEHHEILATTFPEFEPTWDRFASVVRRLKKPHIKIELSEIWDIDQIEPDDFARFAKGELERLSKTLGVDQIELPDLPDWQAGGFTSRLESALRWFETRSEEDFSNLLEVASITGYDRAKRTFPRTSEEVPRAYYMRGYASRETWWDNASDI